MQARMTGHKDEDPGVQAGVFSAKQKQENVDDCLLHEGDDQAAAHRAGDAYAAERLNRLEQHPLSAAFPAMQPEDFEALRSSIESVGVLNPITLFEGKVIDGWHRYCAAKALAVDFQAVDLAAGIDPRDFVLAQNKARRHITKAQIALAAAAVYDWRPVGANQHGGSALSAEAPKSSAQMAEVAGVGVRTMGQAKAVHARAVPEVQQAVRSGAIGMVKAAAIAKLPEDQQAGAIANPIPAKKVAPEASGAPADLPTQADLMRDALQSLSEENDRLSDRLAVEAMDASEEEKTAAADLIADLRNKVATLEAELAAVRSQRDAYMVESSELKRQCASYQRSLKKGGA